MNSLPNKISKKTLFILIFSSIILFILSSAYPLFVKDDQITSSSYYKPEGIILADLTTIAKKESWTEHNLQDKTELFAKQTIKESFVAQTDNLGIIAIPFDTRSRSVNEKIVFRLKETKSTGWYYQNIYNADQFQNNAPFPFGFPIIARSNNKSYTFQIEALTGKPNNSVFLSKTNTGFFSKYKFSKSELIKNPHTLLQFLILKLNSRLHSFTSGEIIFIFLFSLFPFIFYYFKYKKRFIFSKNNTILWDKNSISSALNLKKYIFYLTTISGVLVFFLSGLVTRGTSFYNLFISDRSNYFMDFFNVMYSLFNGPYTYGSIYPPLPLLVYKLMIRLVPYDIVRQGATAIRASQAGQVVFLFYLVITLFIFFILIMEIKKGIRIEKYIFSFVILLSAPFLFQFERANIIFVALLFLMIFVFFKDDKKPLVREIALISLAISVGIKLYPGIFMLLLLKEKRFRDALIVSIYTVTVLILPIFVLGGISQLPLLVKNVFSTSDIITNWGVGYSVNIQNIVRILFALFGDFGNNPIFIGRIFSFVALILGIASAFFLRSKWKTVALLSLLMILVPSISYEYTLIFMVMPLIIYLDHEEKKGSIDYLYILCFILIFIPFTLGRIDSISNGFGKNLTFPLTYGVLIQNIAITTMAVCLIWEGLTENKLKPTKKFLLAFILKISNQLSKFDKFNWFIPIFVILIYNIIYFNRFFPITEGWFSEYAWLINHGQFPYRDFYFFLTPFYLVKMSIFTTLFGYNILYLRLLGLGVILLITYFLYKNIEIIFGASVAAFVAIVGMIYYQSGNAHITYDFIQFVTLYGLIQSYFLLRYTNASGPQANVSMKWVFLAGLFSGLAFLTKQSNGLMIAIFSFAGLLLLSLMKGKMDALKVSLSYILGFVAPLIVTILWLVANSAFTQFLDQVFSGAASAKGGLVQIFFAWFKNILTYNFIFRFIEISLVVLVFGYWLYFFTYKNEKNENINRVFMFVASLVMLLVVFLPLFMNKATINNLSILGQQGMVGQQGINNIIVAAISIPIISILFVILFFVLNKPFNKSIFLFSFVALGFIYGTGTSAGVSEAGAFIGFCLFIALMLYYRSVLGLGKIFIVLFCISFSFMWVEVKYENPYYWWNLTSSDIRGKLQSTDKIKILRGMYTSADNIKLIEEVTAEIRSGSKSGDPILTFPNIPVFHLFTDRRLPGKALVYWFDFLPDSLALKEAEIIKNNPPKVIVYLDLGASVWEAHENLFRGGKPSGQRKIVEAFMELIKSKKMHISKKYNLPNDATLTVWRN